MDIEQGVALGIPAVDKLLPPGPRGSSLLLLNDPGVEAEPFLYQVAKSHLDQGEEVVYIVTTRAPSTVLEAMEAFGLDGQAHGGDLHFVDNFSPLLAAESDASYLVPDPADVDSVLEVLQKAGKEHPDAILLFDSLSGLADHASPEALVEALPAFAKALDAFAYSVSLFTNWPYGFETTALEDSFDAVVNIGALEERVVFGQYFQVQRAAWEEKLSQERFPFKVVEPGGIHVYIPKIVVTGPYNAGKSTFVHTASDTAVSVDRLGTTVALDHGHVTVNGVTADIFGTPGQARFDPILRTVAGKALGVIVLVDSTKPDTFPRARELLEKTVKHGIPVIVGANKQDMPGALSPEEVEERLNPPDHVKVLGVIGQDPTSSRALLETMNDRIVLKGVPA